MELHCIFCSATIFTCRTWLGGRSCRGCKATYRGRRHRGTAGEGRRLEGRVPHGGRLATAGLQWLHTCCSCCRRRLPSSPSSWLLPVPAVAVGERPAVPFYFWSVLPGGRSSSSTYSYSILFYSSGIGVFAGGIFLSLELYQTWPAAAVPARNAPSELRVEETSGWAAHRTRTRARARRAGDARARARARANARARGGNGRPTNFFATRARRFQLSWVCRWSFSLASRRMGCPCLGAGASVLVHVVVVGGLWSYSLGVPEPILSDGRIECCTRATAAFCCRGCCLHRAGAAALPGLPAQAGRRGRTRFSQGLPGGCARARQARNAGGGYFYSFHLPWDGRTLYCIHSLFISLHSYSFCLGSAWARGAPCALVLGFGREEYRCRWRRRRARGPVRILCLSVGGAKSGEEGGWATTGWLQGGRAYLPTGSSVGLRPGRRPATAALSPVCSTTVHSVHATYRRATNWCCCC